jgi:TonB family protein
MCNQEVKSAMRTEWRFESVQLLVVLSAVALLGVSCGKPNAPESISGPIDPDGYYISVYKEIGRHWSPAQDLVEGEMKRVVYIFKIMPEGSIEDIRLHESTGNERFEQSVLKAISASNPVEPHPPGTSYPCIKMVFRLTVPGTIPSSPQEIIYSKPNVHP